MPIKGVWRVPHKLKNGRTRFYYYTSRHGGVKFWQCDDTPLDGKRLPPEFIAAYEEACALDRGHSPGSFARAVEDYKTRSPKYKRMTEKSRDTRVRYLEGWLEMPLKKGQKAAGAPLAVFDRRAVIKYIVDHRDANWGHSPSDADEAMFALSAFLRWAKSEGRLDWNRCEGIPAVYERPTEARIWSDAELLAFRQDADWHLDHFIRLATFVGLRLGDLVQLPRSAITREHIIIPTSKSRGRTTAIVPIVPPVRELLDEIDAKLTALRKAAKEKDREFAEPMTVLFNSRGQPWTADGLSTSFYRHRDKAIKSDDLPTIHDLRKTAATNMVIMQQHFPDQITDQVLCDMFGWTSGTLSKMKRIYVSDAAVVQAMTRSQNN